MDRERIKPHTEMGVFLRLHMSVNESRLVDLAVHSGFTCQEKQLFHPVSTCDQMAQV